MGVGVEEERLFICFGMSGHHLPHPRRSLYAPPVETPAPSAPGQTTQHRQQGRPHRARHDTPGRWTRCIGLHSIPDRPRRVDRDDDGGLESVRHSIMRIMIALSQAWHIDSRLYKYHTNILLHLVIVNYYLSIDI